MDIFEELVGKTVTIKFTSGIEVIAQLLSEDEDNHLLYLGEPRIVIINGEDIALIPYLFTAPSATVSVPTSTVLSIVETFESSTKDYHKIVKNTQKVKDK